MVAHPPGVASRRRRVERARGSGPHLRGVPRFQSSPEVRLRAIIILCASVLAVAFAPVGPGALAAQSGVLLVQVEAEGRPLAGASVRVLSEGVDPFEG